MFRCGLTTYNKVLTGSELCTWLVEFGLVGDRNEAVQYGQGMVNGMCV